MSQQHSQNDLDRFVEIWEQRNGIPKYRRGFKEWMDRAPWATDVLRHTQSIDQRSENGAPMHLCSTEGSDSYMIEQNGLFSEQDAPDPFRIDQIETAYVRGTLSGAMRRVMLMFHEDPDMSVDVVKHHVKENMEGLRDHIVSDHPEFKNSAPSRITIPFLKMIARALGPID